MNEENPNPYNSPTPVPQQPDAHLPPAQPGDDKYAPCPSCGVRRAKICGFTWWGGALGPRMLTHVSCRQCGTKYNGKTGRSNTTGIVIYTAVSLIIGAGLGIAFILWTRQ